MVQGTLVRHLEENLGCYLAVALALLLGTVVGAVSVLFLGQGQELKLGAYVDDLLYQVATAVPVSSSIIYQAAWQGLKEIGVLYFLGLTLIGAPFVLVSIFVHGFVLGFTVAFLVQVKALTGLALALVSVLPPNLFRLSAVFCAGVLSLSSCLSIWRGRHGERSFAWQLIIYSSVMTCLFIVALVGGLVEVYFVPPVIRLILRL